MLAPTQLQQKLSDVFPSAQAMVLTEVIYDSYRDLVKTDDFNELKEIVRQLAFAQQRTEQRVEDLAEAQQQLVDAQQSAEKRIEHLTVAQQSTEKRIEQLTVAQQKTEKALQKLSKQVGGLSDRLGGDLEDAAYIALHDTLLREYGWDVPPIERIWTSWDGTARELDIYGYAFDPKDPHGHITIIGEAKYNLTVNDVKKFAHTVEVAREYLDGEIFPVCFCYRARPEVREAVKEAGMYLLYSYGRLVPPA